MNKKLLTVAILGTMSFSSLILPTAVSAETFTNQVSESEQQLNQSETAIKAAQQKVDGLQAQSSQTEAELAAITNSINSNKDKTTTLLADIEASQKENETLQKEIESLKEKIEQRSEQLENQARTVQVNGDTKNYIEFVIEAESMSDVLGRVDVVTDLVKANKDLVQTQADDKKSVVEKKEKTEQSIVQQNALAAQLENAKAEMEQQSLEKEVVVSQLAIETAGAQADKDKYIAQKAEAESQVAEYTAAQEAAELAVLASYEVEQSEEAVIEESSENEIETSEITEVVEESVETQIAVKVSQPTETSSESSKATSSTVVKAPTQSVKTTNIVSTKAPVKTNEVTQTKAPVKVPVKAPVKKVETETKPVAPKPITQTQPSNSGTSWSALQPSVSKVLGTPYLWGGTSTNGFDCSGFTSYVFAKVGITLPRTAAAQYASSTKVTNPQPGDLVFFKDGGSISHVGIYVGNGQFVGSQSSTGVAYTSVSSSYWGPKIVGYGRY
ncbi:Cell wall-associated hydrolase, NlpC family [Carnobacterium alterfunditum]|uniref:Cell wall-associated hydrolase, NlpC family n=1 Tax=Carnobacterium alterfunditum TaxID=28230 RepID=A0A1N6G5X1_9LACT|nr:NlpC/P60 family protein [Carnobacterium alterfunditum]SIO02907.1 Cell wall-associated hydrolase, NlpC family [Carnobacterium alterfunditum]